jgi:hypothetical protein
MPNLMIRRFCPKRVVSVQKTFRELIALHKFSMSQILRVVYKQVLFQSFAGFYKQKIFRTAAKETGINSSYNNDRLGIFTQEDYNVYMITIRQFLQKN